MQCPFTDGIPNSLMVQVSCFLSPPCTPLVTACLPWHSQSCVM